MSDDRTLSPAAASRRTATCNVILDATSKLVAEKGIAGFTMSEVAERGKVNRALIYHYYHNRDNLIFETIQFIVKRYDEIHSAQGEDEVERNLRMHIDHPEFGRFFFHLMLSGRPLPKLSQRIRGAIGDLERLKATDLPPTTFDPEFAVITVWLVQLAWGCGREEIACLLGLAVEEADRRFLANIRRTSILMRQRLAAGEVVAGQAVPNAG